MNTEFELVFSELCQTYSADGQWVDIQIYQDGDGGWILEVVDEFDTSTVWTDSFPTDEAALAEVMTHIEKEGMESLIGEVDL